MPATVLLVRHATTAVTGVRLGGRTDHSLDERGRAQAEAAAERLAGVPFKAIYSSPLARTRETAALIAAPHRLEVTPDDGLLEVDYGRWTDRPLKPLTRTKLWPVIQSHPALVRFPEGESIRGAQLRAVDAIEAIARRHERQAVAAVTHADVIKAVVAFYLGMPLDTFQRLAVAPASTTVLALGAGMRPTLLRFNDTGPFETHAFRPPRRHQPARRTARPARVGSDERAAASRADARTGGWAKQRPSRALPPGAPESHPSEAPPPPGAA